MVRDAYSAGGQPQQAEGGVAAQPLDLHSSTASLTQELSQLLAASIAQGQAGKRAPSPAAVGSELANLQALVSASVSQNQRPVQPTFRDGLSSLSYARPAQPPMPPPPPVHNPAPVIAPPPAVTVGGLLVTEPHDEEPMPIPSTWRQPMPNDDERWYRQQLGAAGLGLVAGLIVVVPAVLWLSGWLGGPQTKPAVARSQSAPEPAPVKVAEVQPVKVRIATASAEARIPAASEPRAAVLAPVEPPPPPRTRSIAEPPAPVVQAPPPPVVAAVAPRPEPPPAAPIRSRADELLAHAKRLIETKDITGAREVLQTSETASSGPLTFMLAETYDPSMLAIWQVKPDGITANPERARALYAKARDLGDSRAQQRLEWLK
jgi:hypothetical protein